MRSGIRNRPEATRRLIVGLGTAIGLLLPGMSASAGGFYKYTDEQGVVHFSNSPVDSRYRGMRPARQDGLAITPRARPTHRDRHAYDKIIAKTARRYGVHGALVKAVIRAESNFQPNALSRVGAQGLMQLMPETAREMGVDHPFGVVDNIEGGVRYLRLMLERYGDVSRALAAYNAGPSAVDRYRGIPPYPETQAYVKRVLRYYRGYRNDFERPSNRPTPVVAYAGHDVDSTARAGGRGGRDEPGPPAAMAHVRER